MTNLERLIDEFCPGGVEYRTLGEIAIDMYRGSGIKRDQITESGMPCVRYGEIYTTYGVWFDTCLSHTDESTIASKKYFEYGDILFVITGESVDEIAKSSVYIGHEKCLAGGDIVVLKHKQDPKYMGYALSTSDAQMQKSKGKVKSKVVHSSIPALKAIVIPVPPLSIQQEIVHILDTFTALEAELEKRKKQYEYYCNKLLAFDADTPIV
jgi:type I restriction enzyme S subunit